ncbi:MAG: GatB/YqeY domain-containing protein [Desulfobulbaceae bacterium]|nr:GatB/YqeY domain-containing protein [Desulfobulbaceae bacterium]
MALQEIIKDDLKKSMLARDEARMSALRVLIGEFQRQGVKILSDQEVLAVIRKLIKSETETMARSGAKESPYLDVLEGYMPKAPSEAEIRDWVEKNINFADFPNKMQAMKPIMANYSGLADGNLVRQILEKS